MPTMAPQNDHLSSGPQVMRYEPQGPSTSHGMPQPSAPQQPIYPNQRPYSAGPNYPRSPSRATPALRSTGYDQTQHWMANHYMGNQGPQFNPSPAPSVMSTDTHMSMDRMSGITMHSTMTMPLGQATQGNELRGNFSSAASTSSCIENVNPDPIKFMNDRLDEMVRYFGNQLRHAEVVRKIHQLAENPSIHKTDKAKLRSLISKMRDALYPQPQMQQGQLDYSHYQNIHHLLTALYRLVKNKDIRPIVVDIILEDPRLLNSLGFWMRHDKFATGILHELVCIEDDFGTKVRHLARTQQYFVDTLCIMIIMIRSRISYIHIKMLDMMVQSNYDLMTYVLEKHDMLTVLLNVIVSGTEECRVFTFSILVVSMRIETVGNVDIKRKFVEMSGIQKVAQLLTMKTHKRELQKAMRLLCLVSDVQLAQSMDLTGSLQRVCDILVVDDVCVRKNALGFFINVIANNPQNKAVLLEKKCISSIAALFVCYSRRNQFTANERRFIDELVENGCIAMTSLIRMDISAEMKAERDATLNQPIFIATLLNMLQENSLIIQGRIVRLIEQFIQKVDGWFGFLLSSQDETKKESLAAILLSVISRNKQLARENEARVPAVNFHISAFRLLNFIMRHSDAEQKDAVINAFRMYFNGSPIDVIRSFGDDEAVVVQVLEFGDFLCDDSQAQICFAADRTELESLSCHSGNPSIAQFARSIVGKLSSAQDFEPLAGVFMGSSDYVMG